MLSPTHTERNRGNKVRPRPQHHLSYDYSAFWRPAPKFSLLHRLTPPPRPVSPELPQQILSPRKRPREGLVHGLHFDVEALRPRRPKSPEPSPLRLHVVHGRKRLRISPPFLVGIPPDVEPIINRHRLRHSHGGTGAASRHNPRLRDTFLLGSRKPTMNDTSTSAAHGLLETGTLVLFRVVDTHTEASHDKENVFVRADLVFTGDDEDTDPDEIAEWAAFGFLFTLAALSFHDARPRGMSEIDYHPNDEFTVADFFGCLSFKYGELHLETDYVRGRSMKTTVTIRKNGTVTLTTWGRGQSALRWLDQLQGKKRLVPVPDPDLD